MSHIIDMTGERFGKLIVLYRVGSTSKGKAVWHCKCECGNEVDVLGYYLRCGDTQSCGCLKKQHSSKLGKRDKSGENNPNYRGGISSIDYRHKGQLIVQEARKEALIRDNFTCQICGNAENLEVHHILPIRFYPELEATLGNLITLCVDCHHKAHKRQWRN